VRALTFDGDGETLFSASDDGTVRAWRVAPEENGKSFTGVRQPLWFSANGEMLITWEKPEWNSPEAERRLRRLDLARGIETDLPVQPSRVRDSTAQAVSADGLTVAVGRKDGAVELWLLEAATAPEVLPGDGQEIKALRFAPRGGLLAAMHAGPGRLAIAVWDLARRRRQAEIKNTSRLADFSPDGGRLAGFDSEGVLTVWQSRTGEKIASLDDALRFRVDGWAFSPDGKWLALGGYFTSARLWRIGSRVMEPLGGPTSVGPAALAFTPDGQRSVGATLDNVLLFWDVASRKLLLRVPRYRPAGTFLLLAPDASVLALRSEARDRELELWRFPGLAEIDAMGPVR
jgi:WD40 repeat protein